MFKILGTYSCWKKYIKCFIWKVAVGPSYIQDARFLKVNYTVSELLATEVHVTSCSCFAVQNRLQSRNRNGHCSLQSGHMMESAFWAADDALWQTESHRPAASVKDDQLCPKSSTNDIKLPSMFTQFFYWNLLLFTAVVLYWDYLLSVWNLKETKIICCLFLPDIRKSRFVSTFLVFARLSFW